MGGTRLGSAKPNICTDEPRPRAFINEDGYAAYEIRKISQAGREDRFCAVDR
jgi:hypothetical protein